MGVPKIRTVYDKGCRLNNLWQDVPYYGTGTEVKKCLDLIMAAADMCMSISEVPVEGVFILFILSV